MSEKESVEVESTSPPLMYSTPPLDVVVHEMNSTEERESLCPSVRVTDIVGSVRSPLNVILMVLSVSVPLDVMEMSECPSLNGDVIRIAKN